MLLDLIETEDLGAAWEFDRLARRRGIADGYYVVVDPTALLFAGSDRLLANLGRALEAGRLVAVPAHTRDAAVQVFQLFSQSSCAPLAERGKRAFERLGELEGLGRFAAFERPQCGALRFLMQLRAAGGLDARAIVVTGDQSFAYLCFHEFERASAVCLTNDGCVLLGERPGRDIPTVMDAADAAGEKGGDDGAFGMTLYYEYPPGSGRAEPLSLAEEDYLTARSEAMVYRAPGDGTRLAKVFRRNLTEREKRHMYEIYRWAADDYAYPDEILYRDRSLSLPCGYLMPQLGGKGSMDADVFITVAGTEVVDCALELSLGTVLDLLVEFLAKAKYAHMNGALINDYNFGNFRIDLAARPFRKIKFIDVLGYITDEYVSGYRAGFACPFDFMRRTIWECLQEDLFHMTMATFGILSSMLGGPSEPFTQDGRFFFSGGRAINSAYQAAWDDLPPELKRYFRTAFDGRGPRVFDNGDTLTEHLLIWRDYGA